MRREDECGNGNGDGIEREAGTAAGYGSPRKRRGPKHRSRRERRSSEGAMLQLDGSLHVYYQDNCLAKTTPPPIPPSVIRVRHANGRYTEECQWMSPKDPGPAKKPPTSVSTAKEKHPNKPGPDQRQYRIASLCARARWWLKGIGYRTKRNLMSVHRAITPSHQLIFLPAALERAV